MNQNWMDGLEKLIQINPKLHGNIDYFIKHYPIKDVIFKGNNALIRGTSDMNWVFFLVNDRDGFMKLLPLVKETDKHFSVIEEYMVDELAEEEDITMSLDCMRVILSDEGEADIRASMKRVSSYEELFRMNPEYGIRPLEEWDVSFIFHHYDYASYTTKEYLAERIRKDIGYGITYRGKLVAWGMTHDEGSIGVLHVLEAHRRKSLGRMITKIITYEKLIKGEIPFMHIEHDNIASLRMAESLGFVKDRRILWISRR